MTIEQTEEKTLATLTEEVEYYRDLQDQIQRLGMTKDIIKMRIMDAFKVTGMREYTTGKKVKAWIETRASQRISVKEARELLDEDTFNKLVKETVSVILTIRQLEEKE